MTGLLGATPTARKTARVPRDQRRRQIIDEATRIIGQRGYYGFSMQELADSCGLTVAGVLHHVGSKEDLLVALLQARDQRDRDMLGKWAQSRHGEDGGRQASTGRPTLEDCAGALRQIVIRNAGQPEFVRLYSILRAESLYPEHPAREYFTARDQDVLSAFTRLFTGLADHPGSLARQVLALMGGLEDQWLRDPAAVDLVREWDRAMDTVITSLSAR